MATKAVADVEQQIGELVKSIPRPPGTAWAADAQEGNAFAPPAQRKREPSKFAALGHSALDAMIQAAEEVVKRAHENLERVKQHAEEMRQDFDRRDEEIEALERRVSAFGKAQLDAHQQFQNDKEPPHA